MMVAEVLKFAEDVASTNREAPNLEEVVHSEEFTPWMHQQAARTALATIKLHDELAGAINENGEWKPFAISEEHKRALQKLG